MQRKLIIITVLMFCSISIIGQKLSTHNYQKMNFQKEVHLQHSKNIGSDFILPLQTVDSIKLIKSVFGYLPDWEYGEDMHQFIKYDLITHIACFDFHVNSDGRINNPNYWPWTDVINKAHSFGVKVILCATNFNPDSIRTIISNLDSRSNFFEQAKSKIEEFELDGINIDFENLYDNDEGKPINSFMSGLAEFIHAELPGKEVSFAAPPINWNNDWNFYDLVKNCDYVFVMAYDFNGSWSAASGPSAPLTGGLFNLTSALNVDYADVIKAFPSKLILGIPYYGSHWITKSSEARSEVIEFIDSPRFKDTQPSANLHGILWDNLSQTPWFRSQDSVWNQTWFDNEVSIGLKYDVAISKNLKGVGMWALGYDGNRNELWNLIDEKFGSGVLPLHLITDDFKLYPNFPNPFSEGTNIIFNIPEPGAAKIQIFDLAGQLIFAHEEYYSRQLNWYYWNGRGLAGRIPASGTYFCKVTYISEQDRRKEQTIKFLLLK
ncbi:MAG: T9SS type A sorting domain-containing protein [Bacteroidetes bacterium]|nr:T9SS type A sorting domain-containing protein [Bacteroidota bacterium]